MTKPRLTREQKAALARYENALRQEDRLGGSVFANAFNMRQQEAKTKEAYEACLRLGMTAAQINSKANSALHQFEIGP